MALRSLLRCAFVSLILSALPAFASEPDDPPAAELPDRVSSQAAPFVPRGLYAKAAPAVAFILASDPEDGSAEIGTGSLLDAKGRVLTNAHVVIRRATGRPWPLVQVFFKPARMSGDVRKDLVEPREGTVAAFDQALDLAVVELPGAPAVAPLALGDPAAMAMGDQVAAIGHPENGGLWTLTSGVVSTLIADVGGIKGKHAFQTDVSINRGNSGGPLLNSAGEIVGINTLIARKAADGLAITGVNFAIRSDVARWWLAKSGFESASAPVLAAAKPQDPAPSPAAPEPAEAPAAAPKDPPAAEPAAAAPKAEEPPAQPAEPPEPSQPAAAEPPRPAKPPKPAVITESRPYSLEDIIRANARDAFDELEAEERKHRR